MHCLAPTGHSTFANCSRMSKYWDHVSFLDAVVEICGLLQTPTHHTCWYIGLSNIFPHVFLGTSDVIILEWKNSLSIFFFFVLSGMLSVVSASVYCFSVSKTVSFLSKDMMKKPCFRVCLLIKTSPPVSFCFTSYIIVTLRRSFVVNPPSCSVDELRHSAGGVSQSNEFVTVVLFLCSGAVHDYKTN